MMHAFDVLADPVRRRTLELISIREHTSGEVVTVIKAEFGISQSAVSQHLRVLRDNDFARVRQDGSKRCYSINTGAFAEVDCWLDQVKQFWAPRLAALDTEIERGKRQGKRDSVGK